MSDKYHIVRVSRERYEDSVVSWEVETLDEVYTAMVKHDWYKEDTLIFCGERVNLDRDRLQALFDVKRAAEREEREREQEERDRAAWERLRQKFGEEG